MQGRAGVSPEKSQFPGDRSAISGHRYYSPSLGRFICRDPKEESGGTNLYAFLHNNSINSYDYLGWGSAEPGVEPVQMEVMEDDFWSRTGDITPGPKTDKKGNEYTISGSGQIIVNRGGSDVVSFLAALANGIARGQGGGSSSGGSASSSNSGSFAFMTSMAYGDTPVFQVSGGNANANPQAPDSIVSAFNQGIEQSERSQAALNSLESLGRNISNSIESFSAIGTDFENANRYNDIQAGIALIQGGATVTQLAVGLVRNAASYAPVIGATGRYLTSPTIREMNTGMQAANAVLLGGSTIAQEGGQSLLGDYNNTTQRIFTPFQAAAETGIQNADRISQQTASIIQQMQQTYAVSKGNYDKEFGGSK